METDTFIQALGRFIKIRGATKEIWSNNGTNFRGGEKELIPQSRKKLFGQLTILALNYSCIAKKVIASPPYNVGDAAIAQFTWQATRKQH